MEVAVDEGDRRAQIAELGTDHEPEAGAGAEPGVGERDPRRGDGELADAGEAPGLRLVDEPPERRARDGERRRAARGQERPDLLPAAGDRARDDTDARDVVELSRSRPGPNTSWIARASIRSFCGVAVPCAFT